MSTFEGEDARREIIIVKRGGGGEEEGHHGGVWKIAFADFMTAMMCFFLVMWLVNAASEQTKSAVASYFNPMTLVEPNPSGAGVDDPGVSPRSQPDAGVMPEVQPGDYSENTADKTGPADYATSQDDAEVRETSDRHLFADPYAVLAEIASETGTMQNISSKGDGGAQAAGPSTGAQGGESYRDPFAPDFWSQEIADPDAAELDVFREPEEVVEASPSEPEPVVEQAAATGADALFPDEPAPPAAAPTASEQLAEELRERLRDAFGAGSPLNETISVVASAEGVLISLTDEFDYGMFQVGSAVPRRELVLAMERIGETLREKPGKLRINGHTDARPFRSENYDNWRLSSARAHAAYYMLVRAGMAEDRFRSVAGFADRELKFPDDPNADGNRRIEILLEPSL